MKHLIEYIPLVLVVVALTVGTYIERTRSPEMPEGEDGQMDPEPKQRRKNT